MKITLEDKPEVNRTALDDNASIYQKKENKTPKEIFKELKGKEKVTYFCNYYLGKILLALAVVILVVSLIYTMFFKVVPEDQLCCYVINSPLSPAAVTTMKEELTELFVKDEDREQITVDDNYYFWSADYNYRMAFVAHIASGEVDMLILDRNEFYNQVNNEILVPVDKVISPELYSKLSEYYELATPKFTDYDNVEKVGEEAVYGLNVAPLISRINSDFVAVSDYCVAFVANSQHTDKFDDFVKYLYKDVDLQ